MEEGNDRVNASQWISNIYKITADAVRRRSSRADGLLVGFQERDLREPSLLKQVSVDFFFGGLQFLNRNIGKKRWYTFLIFVPLYIKDTHSISTTTDAVVESVTGSTLSSTGFVTFTDMATVVAAGKTPHSHDPDLLRVSIAPDPRDIIWENAHVNDSFNKGREFTVSRLYSLRAFKWYVRFIHLIFYSYVKGKLIHWVRGNPLVYSSC